MKIIYCIAATCNSGGMERVLADKANWFARNGHTVAIITTDQRGQKPFFPLDKKIATYDLGIDYEANNGCSFLSKALQYPLKQWRHRWRLHNLLKRLDPDITVSMFDNEAAILSRMDVGGKKVLEVHFSRFKRLQYDRKGVWALADKWRSRIDLSTARRFDRFVTLTEEDRGYWKNVPGITHIPNAAPFEAGQPADPGNRKVLAVGRLSHQKGFDRLIDAWSRIAHRHLGWQLEIVGSGELKQQLTDIAGHLGTGSSVIFTERCTDMPAKYREASILAMTSRYEGLPMALIEAQTCGLPIVAMDCKCGPRDVITDGFDGFVTPDNDIDTFADRLDTLMRDESLRREMGLRAKTASLRFDTDKIMSQWLSLFNELLSE